MQIAVLSIHSQELSNLYVKGNPEYLPNEIIDNNIKDANGEVCAGLIVQTDLTGFTFDSNNGFCKEVSTKAGEYFLYLQSTERIVKIYREGYTPLELILANEGIVLASGKVWKITVTGDKKSESIPVNIITIPSNADVKIDGIEKTGGPTYQLAEGSHTVAISKEGYKTITEEITITKQNNYFSYELEKVNVVGYTILSDPPGAKIFLNNAEKGETPDQNFVFPGTYELKLILPGYLNIEKIIKIREEGENEFNYQLTKNTGKILLNITPQNAAITIDGKEIYVKEIELTPGTHSIFVSNPGYRPVTEEVEVKLGETKELNYNLPKNSVPVTLEISPKDATVRINKEDFSNHKSFELAPGTWIIEIEKEGYYSIDETVTLKLGESLRKIYSLKEKVGTLQFRVKPITANVKLLKNGKVLDEWEGLKIINGLHVGDYEVECKADGYKTYKEDIVIKENENTITEIEMIEGSDMLKGSLRITVTPSNANIILRKYEKKIDEWRGNKTINNLSTGSYQIKVSSKDYKPHYEEVIVSDNQVSKIFIILEHASSKVPVQFLANNRTFYLDGKNIGKISDKKLDVLRGNHEIKCGSTKEVVEFRIGNTYKIEYIKKRSITTGIISLFYPGYGFHKDGSAWYWGVLYSTLCYTWTYAAFTSKYADNQDERILGALLPMLLWAGGASAGFFLEFSELNITSAPNEISYNYLNHYSNRIGIACSIPFN